MSTLALSKIEEEILADAQEEANRRIQEAEKEAAAIIEKAKAEAQRKVEEIKARVQEQIKILERKKLSEARRKAALAVLEEKNTLIDKVFKEALKRVRDLKTEDVEKSAKYLLEEAIKSFGSGDLKLQVSSKERKVYENVIKSLNTPRGVTITLEKDPLPSSGGFIISTADGQIKIDNTFETRLESVSRSLRKEVAAILFGQVT
ncbi:MAG: V-type ATP synthase subunit E [Candidatus Bathyarchaeia archaeon]